MGIVHLSALFDIHLATSEVNGYLDEFIMRCNIL